MNFKFIYTPAFLLLVFYFVSIQTFGLPQLKAVYQFSVVNDCFQDNIPFNGKAGQVKVSPAIVSNVDNDNREQVVISGGEFGNGWDILSVTLCGVEVHQIIMQSSDVVVVYPNSGTPGTGDIVITSESKGKTVLEKAFTYQIPAPLIPAKNIKCSGTANSAATITWDRGDGDSCVVFMKKGRSTLASPKNQTTYFANSEFGHGTEIGQTGWYCVYNGKKSSATVNGLLHGETYTALVFEYNGALGTEHYLVFESDKTDRQAQILSFISK